MQESIIEAAYRFLYNKDITYTGGFIYDYDSAEGTGRNG